MKFAFLAATAALAACNPVDYGTKQTVQIDGKLVTVYPSTNMPSVYMAIGANTGTILGDPTVYSRNVRAIEAISQCKVDMASITNEYLSTSAAVICDG